MRASRSLATLAVIVFSATAQQPNTSTASLTINGANGPPFPINATVLASSPASALILGNPNVPYAVLQSATGILQTGSPTLLGGQHLDLPVAPLPIVLIDGFTQPGFHTSFAGQASISSTLPQSTIGASFAFQAVLADPGIPAGLRLSAATGFTVTPGPVSSNLLLGDEGTFTTTLPFPIPFYGVDRTSITVSANGYLTFGTSFSDFTPSDAEFINQLPRVAAYWSDLDQQNGSIVLTVAPPLPPSIPGYVQVAYTNVQEFTVPIFHTFAMLMHSDGALQISHAQNLTWGIYDLLVGISAGGGLNPQPEKDLSAYLAPNSLTGGVNESFYQWFGLPTIHPFYTQSSDPYDLGTKTLNFVPMGAGGLPGSTDRYTMY